VHIRVDRHPQLRAPKKTEIVEQQNSASRAIQQERQVIEPCKHLDDNGLAWRYFVRMILSGY